MDHAQSSVTGKEHWTHKGDIKLFLWEKYVGKPDAGKPTVLFVHGSSMASQPTFDLHVPGRRADGYHEYLGYSYEACPECEAGERVANTHGVRW